MLKNVEKEYFEFIMTYLNGNGSKVSLTRNSETDDRYHYAYNRITWSLDDRVILEEDYISRSVSGIFAPNSFGFPKFFIEEEYLTDFFITLFEAEGNSSSIKSYFVCWYDSETKQLGNDVIKIYKGIKDKDSLNRVINKLNGKVILNYKEI